MHADVDLRHLRHLVLLAEELNFSRAADRAHLSQTAFSRSIQALESGFGLRLFDRGTRSVRLTAAGRQLLSRARDVLGQAADLAREVDELAQAEGGELSFGAGLITVEGVLQGVLPRFRRLHPHVRLDVKVSQSYALQSLLEQERIEFFVAYGEPLRGDPAFTVTPLGVEPASVFCRADHPLVARRQPATRREVLSYPWAAAQAPEPVARRVRQWFELPATASLPTCLVCDNTTLLREAMLADDTLVFTWTSWLREDMASGTAVDLGRRMRPVLPSDLLAIDCSIVRLAQRTLSPAAQRLMALIVESAAKRS